MTALLARRVPPGMAVALAKGRNAVQGRCQANPEGAPVVAPSRVAVLDKGYGHCLRTASCCETPRERWILKYQVDRVLAAEARKTQL